MLIARLQIINFCRSRRHAQILRMSAGVLARLRHGGSGFGRVLCYSDLLPNNPEQRAATEDAGGARRRSHLRRGTTARVP